jgi:hypothetical protein
VGRETIETRQKRMYRVQPSDSRIEFLASGAVHQTFDWETCGLIGP